jgi:hypothetical protein
MVSNEMTLDSVKFGSPLNLIAILQIHLTWIKQCRSAGYALARKSAFRAQTLAAFNEKKTAH